MHFSSSSKDFSIDNFEENSVLNLNFIDIGGDGGFKVKKNKFKFFFPSF